MRTSSSTRVTPDDGQTVSENGRSFSVSLIQTVQENGLYPVGQELDSAKRKRETKQRNKEGEDHYNCCFGRRGGGGGGGSPHTKPSPTCFIAYSV